jgi:predicted P-loop ATPase
MPSSICATRAFHPVRDYLAGLKWDNVPRIDNWLHEYAGADDTPFNNAVGRIFLIAAVRRVQRPGCKFDTLIVFESPQGKDKSLALRVLAVRPEWFTDNLPLNADPKVVIEQTEGVWIVEYAELSGIKDRDINHVKNLLSKQDDRARAAYGRKSQRVPRQWVSAASTNDGQYLLDDENRRFWPVALKQFDLEKLKRDVDQLWAEASHYEGEGESITLQRDLWPAAADAQNKRKIGNPILDRLTSEYGSKEKGWVSDLRVWQVLGIPIERRPNVAGLMGRAMRQLGFDRLQARGGPSSPKNLNIGQHYYIRGMTDDERFKKIEHEEEL